MGLKPHQRGEIIGVLMVLGATAVQLFYLEPMKREIEWRLAAFNVQQSGQVQTKAIYDARVDLLKAANAPDDRIKAAEAERDATIAKYKTADANISDYLFDKGQVEEYLQWLVAGLFILGTMLTAYGRARELRGD